MNTHVPEEYGGPGLLHGRLPHRGGARLGLLGHRHDLGLQRPRRRAGHPRRLGGDQEEVPRHADRGVELASFCLTEPDAGSDVSGMRTRAVKKGDKYVINGSKCFITNGGYADWYTVYAKTDKDAGHRGISAFVVPKDDTVDRGQEGGQDGPAGVQHRDHHLQRHRGPGREPARRGEQGLQARDDDPRPHAPRRRRDGRPASRARVRVRHRVLQGARPVRRADRHAPGDPVHDRRHGDQGRGRAPGVWKAAPWMLDQGERNTIESSHAKRFAADTAMKVATDAVQVYGGYGFIKEYPVEKLMRDAKIMQLYEGTSQIQRLVIARETLLPRRIEEPAAAARRLTALTVRRHTGGHGSSDRPGGAVAEVAAARRRAAAGAALETHRHTGRRRARQDPLVGDLRRRGLLPLLVLHLLRRPDVRPRAHGARRPRPGACGRQPQHDVPPAAHARAGRVRGRRVGAPERRSRRFYRLTPEGAAERDRLAVELGPRLDAVAAGIEHMSRAARPADGPGPLADRPRGVQHAEELWYDFRRWPTFMEGFKHLDKAARASGRGAAPSGWTTHPRMPRARRREAPPYEARGSAQTRRGRATTPR